jgi:hypothetical protein
MYTQPYVGPSQSFGFFVIRNTNLLDSGRSWHPWVGVVVCAYGSSIVASGIKYRIQFRG